MTRRPFTAEDVFNLKCSGDAHLSPDAKSIVYVTQYHYKDKEKSFTDVYIASIETGQSRKLTNSGKDRSPRWSLDGKRVAFVSDRSGKNQVWLIDPNGGEAWRPKAMRLRTRSPKRTASQTTSKSFRPQLAVRHSRQQARHTVVDQGRRFGLPA